MNKQDIVSRLLAGESLDAIADELTNSLNDAKTEADKILQERKEKEIAEKAAAEAKAKAMEERRADMRDVLAAINTYAQKHMNESVATQLGEYCTDFDDAELDEFCNALDSLVVMFQKYEDLEKNLRFPAVRARSQDLDDLIKLFFN